MSFDEFISMLIQSINTDGLWSTLGACVPLIAISVFFGLGIFMIIRLIRGIIRARGGF